MVALFLENKPEYICIWLGLSKLGVIIPLINTNQRLSSLVHSITIAKSQAVIFGTELTDGKSFFLNVCYQIHKDAEYCLSIHCDTVECLMLFKISLQNFH